MGLQDIIDNAQDIEIDRRRVVGQTMSRSQRIKTAERASAQPLRLTVSPPAMMKWSSSREMIQAIEQADRVDESEVSLSNSTGMQYITAYRGSLSSAQLNAITIQTASTNTLVLTDLPSVSSSVVMFRPGDFIQPTNSRYPYTVVSTSTRGVNTTTTVVLNREIITSEDITLAGQGILVGNDVTWRMVVVGLPSYKLIPGGFVQYTGSFELVEKIV